MNHPGFAAVQKGIASKEGVGQKAAGAILASSTRKASAKAKKKNPNLKKVKDSGAVHGNSGMNMNKGMSYVS